MYYLDERIKSMHIYVGDESFEDFVARMCTVLASQETITLALHADADDGKTYSNVVSVRVKDASWRGRRDRHFHLSFELMDAEAGRPLRLNWHMADHVIPPALIVGYLSHADIWRAFFHDIHDIGIRLDLPVEATTG